MTDLDRQMRVMFAWIPWGGLYLGLYLIVFGITHATTGPAGGVAVMVVHGWLLFWSRHWAEEQGMDMWTPEEAVQGFLRRIWNRAKGLR